MVEAARLGQLSTVRKLLDSGTATVEDRDEVRVCVRIYLLCYFKAAIYDTNCISFLIIPHTPGVSLFHACTIPPTIEEDDSTVVGITQRSPASGERVGKCVQSESVSKRQGTSYSCTCYSTLQFVK